MIATIDDFDNINPNLITLRLLMTCIIRLIDSLRCYNVLYRCALDDDQHKIIIVIDLGL